MFSQEVLDVLFRDHKLDTDRLNKKLNMSGEGSLVSIPPHTYVGRVETNYSDESKVLLLGINPKYSKEEKYQSVNVDLPTNCINQYNKTKNAESLRPLFEFQEGYFLREERNKRHFTKFGNWFGRHWFGKTYGSGGSMGAQRVLDKHVVEMDVLQYFSDRAQIDSELLAQIAKTDPALLSHRMLIESVIERIQPLWIQVNGKSCWKLMESYLFDSPGISINPTTDTKTELIVGMATIGTRSGPVLMHKFLNQSGPQRKDQQDEIAVMWDEWRMKQ